MAIAAVIGALIYYSQHLPDEIRQHVQQKFAAHYTNLQIDIHSAQLLPEEGIIIRGLTILDPGAPKSEQILVSVDEMLLACRTSLTQLAQEEPQITHIIVRRPRINARVNQRGEWNLAKLFPAPKFGKVPVVMNVEGGQIEVHDPRRTPAALYTVRDIQCELTPTVQPTLLAEVAWDIRGKLAGDALRHVEFATHITPVTNSTKANFKVQGLQFSPEWTAHLPTEVAEPLQALGMLRGEVQLDGEFFYKPTEARPIDFVVNGELHRGRIDDPRLPQVWNDVQAKFSADRTGMMVQDFTARNGTAELQLAVIKHGYTANSPLNLTLQAKHLTIDRSWETFLPAQYREAWLKFLPTGVVHVQGQLDFDGQQWQPKGTLDVLNLSFTYHKFPYRMHNTQGQMTWQDQQLIGNLETTFGSKRVKIGLDIKQPGENFIGAININGQGLTLDQNMLAALPEQQRNVIASLNPVGGTFDLNATMSRTTATQSKTDLAIRWDLHRVAVKYEKFQYPLMDVSGTVELKDNIWTFRDLVGYNDKGKVTCQGSGKPAEQGFELQLNFAGQEISLEEELRDALPTQVQHFWKNLNPSGFVNLKADWSYQSAEKKSTISLSATPVADTVVFEPSQFPLRLEKVHGQFQYRPGRMDFTNVTAEHEKLPIVTEGFCEHDDQGAWHLRFNKLIADRIRPERASIQTAMPARLRKAVQAINFAGPLNLNGTFDLWHQLAPAEPFTAAWDMQVDIRDGAMQCAQKIDHIDGAVRLVGQATTNQLRMQGELNLDSMMTNELHLTEIRGPLWVDETQVLLGVGALPANHPQRRNLSAKCYGGKVLADAWLNLTQQRYSFQARLDDFNLAQYAREQLPGKQNLSGKIQLGLELGGTLSGLHTLAGRGQMYLHEANLGELPVMLAMLKILSIREPDRTAFDSGDVNFRIEGEHIYFDSIELTGNAISLLGTGEMNLQRELQLVFSAVAGRSDWQVPVIKSVLGSASQQLMEIHVGGTLADPEIKREAFPALKQTLDQLQVERRQRRSASR